jgi:serine/threonine protein kinase
MALTRACGHAGTVTHMAPELIERGEVSTACDVYAFGILMWECYTRLTPYKGLGPPQVLVGVVSSRLRPAFSASTPPGSG